MAVTILGTALRAWQLADHPLWSDEFATLVFSLGQGFTDIPLDQGVAGDRLLESLTVQSSLGPGAALERLMTESNHPPLYFLLSNLWIHLWQSPGQLVDLEVVRSLPALFGILAIPGTYCLVKVGTEQHSTAFTERVPLPLVAAFLMAVSPFGIYLSQETRHYTLGLVWAITSLCCWTIFVRHWSEPDPRSRSPRWLPWLWILVNGLGIATHFFVGLLLGAQAIALGILGVRWGLPRLRERWSLAIAVLGTTITALVWIPYAQGVAKAGLTDWLSETVTWITGIEAIARLIAWTVTMGILLPVENQPTDIWVTSGYFMAIATGSMIVGLWSAWRSRHHWLTITHQRIFLGLGVLLGALFAVMLGIVLSLGKDITVAARYQFVTLPVVIALMAVGWWGLWRRRPRIAIAWLLMTLISGGCVAQGLAFQRPDRPDLMVDFIAQIAGDRPDTASTVIATVYKNHEQTGEILGLAWEWRSHSTKASPQFLLAKKAPDHPAPNDTLQTAITPLPKPLDLWLVNFAAPENLEESNQCQRVPDTKHRVPGYSAKLYRCP